MRGLVRTGGTCAQRCGILGSDILTVANTDIARGITTRISICRIRIPRRTRLTRRPRIIISRLRRHRLYGLGTICTIRRTTRLNRTITRSRTVRIGNITARTLGTRIPFRHRRTVCRHTAIYLGPGPFTRFRITVTLGHATRTTVRIRVPTGARRASFSRHIVITIGGNTVNRLCTTGCRTRSRRTVRIILVITGSRRTRTQRIRRAPTGQGRIFLTARLFTPCIAIRIIYITTIGIWVRRATIMRGTPIQVIPTAGRCTGIPLITRTGTA